MSARGCATAHCICLILMYKAPSDCSQESTPPPPPPADPRYSAHHEAVPRPVPLLSHRPGPSLAPPTPPLPPPSPPPSSSPSPPPSPPPSLYPPPGPSDLPTSLAAPQGATGTPLGVPSSLQGAVSLAPSPAPEQAEAGSGSKQQQATGNATTVQGHSASAEASNSISASAGHSAGAPVAPALSAGAAGATSGHNADTGAQSDKSLNPHSSLEDTNGNVTVAAAQAAPEYTSAARGASSASLNPDAPPFYFPGGAPQGPGLGEERGTESQRGSRDQGGGRGCNGARGRGRGEHGALGRGGRREERGGGKAGQRRGGALSHALGVEAGVHQGAHTRGRRDRDGRHEGQPSKDGLRGTATRGTPSRGPGQSKPGRSADAESGHDAVARTGTGAGTRRRERERAEHLLNFQIGSPPAYQFRHHQQYSQPQGPRQRHQQGTGRQHRFIREQFVQVLIRTVVALSWSCSFSLSELRKCSVLLGIGLCVYPLV